MTELNKDYVCRVCLGNVKKRDKSIGEEFLNIPIFHHIMSIADVNISVDDDLPDKICRQCFKELETSIKFKRKCEENNAVYQETFLVHTKSSHTRAKSLEINEAKIKKESEDEILYDPEQFDDFVDVHKSDDDTSTNYNFSDDANNEVSNCRANANYIVEPPLFDYDGRSIQIQNLQDAVKTQDKGHNGQLQCDDCKEYFKSKMKLQVHWKRVHLPALLTCQSCQRSFKAFKALRGHQQKQPRTCLAAANFIVQGTGNNKTRVCKLCGVKCEDSQIFCHYTAIHADKKLHSFLQKKDNQVSVPPRRRDENSYKTDLHVQCDDCNEFFRTKTKLTVHWKQVHMPQRLTCQICQRRFKSYKAFNFHQKKKPMTCTEAVNFNIEYVGKRRQFQCKLCNYKNFKLGNMIKHNRVHTGERPYVCNKCSSSYKTSLSLSIHMECAHKEYKIITPCQYCGIMLKGSSKIRGHMEKHKIQPKVQCDFCAKTFKCKKYLKSHIISHTGEKKYQCENCPKKFYRKNEYNRHTKKGHKKRPGEMKKTACVHCSYASPSLICILKHQEKHKVCEFNCCNCGMFLKSAQSLEAHKQTIVHCPYCKKKFCRTGHVHRHIKNNHSQEAKGAQERR